MTEKQMRQLTEMINIDNRVDIVYSPHPVDQTQSESERVLNKLHDLYGMQLKLISEEKFELAEEIKQTILTIKENYKL